MVNAFQGYGDGDAVLLKNNGPHLRASDTVPMTAGILRGGPRRGENEHSEESGCKDFGGGSLAAAKWRMGVSFPRPSDFLKRNSAGISYVPRRRPCACGRGDNRHRSHNSKKSPRSFLVACPRPSHFNSFSSAGGFFLQSKVHRRAARQWRGTTRYGRDTPCRGPPAVDQRPRWTQRTQLFSIRPLLF
jgi:hypothetical protein